MADEVLKNELIKWKQHHLIVCKFVARMNACFGLIILMQVSRSFIFFTMKIYDVISQPETYLKSPFCFAFWTWLLFKSVDLTLIIYIPHHLKQKVKLFYFYFSQYFFKLMEFFFQSFQLTDDLIDLLAGWHLQVGSEIQFLVEYLH